MKKLMKWLLGFYLLFFCGFVYSVCCLNNQGDPVDWWIIIKKPGTNQGQYIDPIIETPKKIELSRQEKLKDQGALQKTLQQAYNESSFLLMYNDQPVKEDPDSNKEKPDSKSNVAHAKGVVSFDSKDGFWLVHSLPRFPKVNFPKVNKDSLEYHFAENGIRLGQSFLCMSINKHFNGVDQLEKVKTLLLKMSPNVYYFSEKNGDEKHPANFSHSTTELYSFDGIKFASHVQPNINNEKDVYEYASGKLQKNMSVQSYLNNDSPVITKPASIKNVQSLSHEGAAWKSSKDHGKWAIIRDRKTVCIGDLNRLESQKKRGGQLACLESKHTHTFLSKVITPSTESIQLFLKRCGKIANDKQKEANEGRGIAASDLKKHFDDKLIGKALTESVIKERRSGSGCRYYLENS